MASTQRVPFSSRSLAIFDESSGPGATTAFSRACERIQPLAVVAPGPLLSPKIAKLLERNGTRCVLAIGDGPGKSIARLRFSAEPVGEAAAQFLTERGCTRLLAVMPDDPRLGDMSAERLNGIRRVLDEKRLRTVTVPMDLEAARDPILAAVRKKPAADAVFAYNDEYALIVLQVLREGGIAVPEDVAVMGCDNLLFAGLTQPSLTTIDLGDVGSQIAEHLLAMLEGRRRPPTTMVKPTIVPRESA